MNGGGVAVIFVLGPSEWQPADAAVAVPSPRRVRETICATLRARRHDAFLMEGEPDVPGEDLVDKFERLLHERGTTDILLYWPPRAKMATTMDELLLLRDRAFEGALPPIWVLHHRSVARFRDGGVDLLERGGRSRYMSALGKLPFHPLPWDDEDQLASRIERLADLLSGSDVRG